MQFRFQTLVEDHADQRWQSHFEALWPAYKEWFLSEGLEARSTYLAGYRALRAHMPEILPLYEQLCELAGGGDLASRFLSFYNPPAYLSGCSQAVWLGKSGPMLVRNYDYDARLCDGVVMDTAWLGNHRVVAVSDGMWGVVDGMNDQGLALSLTFGGRRIVGEGFGVPLILRYILETCVTTAEALAVLQRVPCHMAYNITCVDQSAHYATAYLSPDRETIISNTRVATNHQENVEWHRHAQVTATVERERFLLQQITYQHEPMEEFINNFLRPPLYSTQFARGFGTLFTSVYWPTTGVYQLRWPGIVWQHKIGYTADKDYRFIQYPD